MDPIVDQLQVFDDKKEKYENIFPVTTADAVNMWAGETLAETLKHSSTKWVRISHKHLTELVAGTKYEKAGLAYLYTMGYSALSAVDPEGDVAVSAYFLGLIQGEKSALVAQKIKDDMVPATREKPGLMKPVWLRALGEAVAYSGAVEWMNDSVGVGQAFRDFFGVDVPENLETMTAVAASETAMTAVAASETAMTAVLASETAMTAVLASETAMTAVAASETAMTAVAASETAMTAVAASETAMTAVAASETAMTAVLASETAMTAVAASETAMTAVAASETAMVILSNSEVAKAKIEESPLKQSSPIAYGGTTWTPGFKLIVISASHTLAQAKNEETNFSSIPAGILAWHKETKKGFATSVKNTSNNTGLTIYYIKVN